MDLFREYDKWMPKIHTVLTINQVFSWCWLLSNLVNRLRWEPYWSILIPSVQYGLICEITLRLISLVLGNREHHVYLLFSTDLTQASLVASLWTQQLSLKPLKRPLYFYSCWNQSNQIGPGCIAWLQIRNRCYNVNVFTDRNVGAFKLAMARTSLWQCHGFCECSPSISIHTLTSEIDLTKITYVTV